MDAGSFSNSSKEKKRSQARAPLRDVRSSSYFPPLRTSSLPIAPSRQNHGDRFIPDRSAMDFDFAHYQLTQSRKEKEDLTVAASPSKEVYRKLLAETLLNNRTRILAFKSKPPGPTDGFLAESSDTASHLAKAAKKRRYISQTAERTLDAPDLVDDYYLNLLDWGSSNVLSIALGNTVYLWNASKGSTSELVTMMTLDRSRVLVGLLMDGTLLLASTILTFNFGIRAIIAC